MRFPRLTLRPARRVDFAPRDTAAARPRLILHAGTQKTGTTAIQYALSENRDALRAAGVSYPPIEDFFPVDPKLSRARAHFAFANAVAAFSPADQQRLSRLVAHIHDEAARCPTTILSAENMYRLTTPATPGGNDATPDDRRKRFLAQLATVTAGFDTEVLIYLRRVDRFAASLYAESIVKTDKSWSFREFVKSRGPRFGYRANIDAFQAHFPVTVRSFEAATDAGLLRSFCADTGIAADLPETDARRRNSVPDAAVLWIRDAKRQTSKMADVERNRRWHFALLPENADLFDAGHPTGFWKNAAQRDAFIEEHQAGVTEIAFPAPEAAIAPRARWDETRHAAAEARFHAWQATNAGLLRRRERRKIPPFVLDDTPGR